MAGDNQAQFVRELRLFNEAKRLCSVGCAAHVAKLTTENRHCEKRLEGIVFN